MIEVCKDIENNGEKSVWSYEDGKYFRHDSAGVLKGQITGQNLPNATQLWQGRCEAYGAEYPSDTIQHPKTGQTIRLRPTEATFKLFEHWNKICSEGTQ